ncbi:hypothetical protein NDU88_000974 [Pleurodeles waltl]|uniref:Uncharacterized protein n=1 Tax=Pleurodeles waltl TaxID=8319 RepID=A0AAV7V8F2_PLEWA|nr:hypothetical protein NDU88_000974 [Pleurodeles waltl]
MAGSEPRSHALLAPASDRSSCLPGPGAVRGAGAEPGSSAVWASVSLSRGREGEAERPGGEGAEERLRGPGEKGQRRGPGEKGQRRY